MLFRSLLFVTALFQAAFAWQQHAHFLSKIAERRIDGLTNQFKKYSFVSLSESESSFGLSEELLPSTDEESKQSKIQVLQSFYCSFGYKNCYFCTIKLLG